MDSFLFRIIMYMTIIFWLLPPIKQYKTNLFGYFFVLALTDPIGLILGKIFLFQPYLFYCFSGIVLLFVTSDFNKVTKKTLIFYIVLLFLAYYSSNSPSKYTFYFIIFIHFLILLIFTKRTLLFAVDTNQLNFFHLVLLFYEVSIIFKMLSVVENFSSGIYYYAISNIFQVIIAIFFTIFNENDKRLLIDLNKLAG